MARRRPLQTEAERLRQHNEEMKLALAENITVIEARRRLSLRRYREFEARLRRCGTSAAENPTTPALGDAGVFGPTFPDRDQALREPRFWWERD